MLTTCWVIYLHYSANNSKLIMDMYSPPDPLVAYDCSEDGKSTGFTIVMKWVMLTRAYPELVNHIKNFIKDNPDSVNKKNTHGWTPLLLAVYNSNRCSTEETVFMLIGAGADVHARIKNGWTALMMAFRGGVLRAQIVLLECYSMLK